MTTPRGQGRKSLVDQVTARLQALVIENALQTGDLLPPERELGELLGVSRTVVREAVRSLVAKGMLEVRQGHGTVVRAPDVRLASEVIANMLRSSGGGRIAFSSVHEVRRLLEVEIAGLAAERCSDDDLRLLEAALAATALPTEPEIWAQADIDFHAAIAAASHNLLFPALLGSMTEIMLQLRLTAARLAETPVRAHAFHVLLFEAIRDRSPVAARRAMHEHMDEAQATFERARILSAVAGSKPAA